LFDNLPTVGARVVFTKHRSGAGIVVPPPRLASSFFGREGDCFWVLPDAGGEALRYWLTEGGTSWEVDGDSRDLLNEERSP